MNLTLVDVIEQKIAIDEVVANAYLYRHKIRRDEVIGSWNRFISANKRNDFENCPLGGVVVFRIHVNRATKAGIAGKLINRVLRN